jgi:hypothetical protein
MHPEPTVNKSQTDPKKTQATLSKPCKKKQHLKLTPNKPKIMPKEHPKKVKATLSTP